MLELLISVIPLILACTAIGLVIINFDEVISYLVFIAQNLIRTPNNPNLINDSGIPISNTPKEKISLLSLPYIFIKRTFTLFRVIFLPDFTLHTYSATTQDVPEVDIIQETAKKSALTSPVKSYQDNIVISNSVHHHFAIIHILKMTVFYLILLIPFALVGATVMLYLNDNSTVQISLNDWLNNKISSIMEYFNTQ